MKLVLTSILTGMLTGAVFTFFKLPLPAPPTFPGVAGIVGVYLGFVVAQQLLPKFI